MAGAAPRDRLAACPRRLATAAVGALAFALATSCAPGPRTGTAPPADPTPAGDSARTRVLLVSIDGLMPDSYMRPDAHGLAVPTLRMLRARGAYSAGVLSVFPTVTYPAHTSMVTGVSPGAHGVTSNQTPDPLNRNQGGWFWYTRDIRAPTLWQVAEQAGLRTALITWPVTVGADVDALVPEFWRAGTDDDLKLIDALSTRGLLDRVRARFPAFRDHFVPPDTQDAAMFDIAEHLLETEPPDLMLLHCWMVDEFQHRDGPWSASAVARIEEADRQLARLLAAVDRTTGWDDTILMIVSDHGFARVETRFRPGVVLRELGLVTPGKGDALADARAWVRSDSGVAYVYVVDEADTATRDALADAFGARARTPGSGLAQVLTRDEIRARGGDPRAALALLPSPSVGFIDGYAGELLEPSSSKGTHGYAPDMPEMRGSMLVYGAGVTPGAIEDARLVDVAPTIAGWLGLAFPEVEGKPLAIDFASGRSGNGSSGAASRDAAR